jgi:DNA-binding CsgD family transcriptional regulator
MTLSQREAECLTWCAKGKTSGEIATILDISKRTVNFHVENARMKLDVATRIQAVAKAISERLIEP